MFVGGKTTPQKSRKRRSLKKKKYLCMLDGFQNVDENIHVSLEFSNSGDHRGPLAFLLGQTSLLRGGNVRALELEDISYHEMNEMGFSKCNALVLLLEEGKTDWFYLVFFCDFSPIRPIKIHPVIKNNPP